MAQAEQLIQEIQYHQSMIGKLTEKLSEARIAELREVQMKAKSKELGRREVAGVLGITREYTYKLNIPFDGRKINSMKLRDWVKLHMPERYSAFTKELERIL